MSPDVKFVERVDLAATGGPSDEIADRAGEQQCLDGLLADAVIEGLPAAQHEPLAHSSNVRQARRRLAKSLANAVGTSCMKVLRAIGGIVDINLR